MSLDKDDPTLPRDRALPRLLVAAYLSGEHAERHRRIVRVFFLNKTRDIGLALTPSEVQDGLRAEFGLVLDLAEIDRSLETLKANGTLVAETDGRSVGSAEEWRRKNFIYDITPAGERVEQLGYELDDLREDVGELDSTRLLVIRDALRRIAEQLAREEPSGGRIGEDLRAAAGATAELREGATRYMTRLSSFMSSSTHSTEDFIAARDNIIDYLQGFHRERRRHDGAIQATVREIEAFGPGRMAEIIVGGRDLAAPIDGVSATEIFAAKREDEIRRWSAISQWFGDSSLATTPWGRLNERVLDSIRAVLEIASRILDRAADRQDRAHAWQNLARLLHGQPEAETRAAFARAVGMRPPRHFGVLWGDHQTLGRPQTISWAAAPPVTVAAHLRNPGARRPGAGTPAPIRRNHTLAARKRREMAEEAERRARLQTALVDAGTLRISDLHVLDGVELRELLGWISRAFATRRRADGSREVTSPDGRLTLRLVPPGDGARTIVRSEDGALQCPDYVLEVVGA